MSDSKIPTTIQTTRQHSHANFITHPNARAGEPSLTPGTHYRRDVTLGEDACRVKDRNAASVLATLRNLTNGIYELEREQERTQVDTLNSWLEQQTFSTAWPLLKR